MIKYLIGLAMITAPVNGSKLGGGKELPILIAQPALSQQQSSNSHISPERAEVSSASSSLTQSVSLLKSCFPFLTRRKSLKQSSGKIDDR